MRVPLHAVLAAALIGGSASAQRADIPESADRPVYIDDAGRTPDGPPSAADTAYDTRLRSSLVSALSFQGPLDGGWELFAGPRELYALQLVDRDGAISGAWRDPGRPGALEASGYIDQVERSEAGLTLRFDERTLELRSLPDGRFAGELKASVRTESVTLRRRSP